MKLPTPLHPLYSILISLLFAVAIANPVPVFAREPDTGKHFIWRVTNVPVPFYLIGTFHALKNNDYPLPAAYQQALKESQRFLFEVVDNGSGEWARKEAKASVYPKGDHIARHVHPETWKFLEKSYRSNSYAGKTWDVGNNILVDITQVRPWAVAGLYGGTVDWRDVRGSLGLDYHFEAEAKRRNKQVAGLETIDEHVQVMAGMNDIESELILLDEIVNREKHKAEFDRVHAAWKRGDVATFWADVQKDRQLNPGAEVRLLDMRNVKWIPKIKAEMKTGKPTCILAGAGHFVGPNGVISLLERAGYKLEQL